jgi:hypothetical protein
MWQFGNFVAVFLHLSAYLLVEACVTYIRGPASFGRLLLSTDVRELDVWELE